VSFREIEHTSETGFIAEGETLNEVFVEAARALFEVMADTSNVEARLEHQVELSAPDVEQLIHNWLEELNFLSQTRHELYSYFEVTIDDNRLSATLRGEPIDLHKHRLRLEVKAVTYGDFYLKKKGDGWETRVIVDV